MLTLIINANMNTLTVITVCNSAEVRAVARFGFHLTDLPRKPASSFRIAMLLDGVITVKVVCANLLIHPLGGVPEIIWGLLTSFPSFHATNVNGEKLTARVTG